MSPIPVSLTLKTGRALRWNYVGMIIKMVLAFAVNTFLTRLLGPKPFGELAVAMVVFGLGTLLGNVGLMSALIQTENLSKEDIRFCFTCQMAIGFVLSLLLFASAPSWAAFFHEQDLTLLLRVFSSLFVIQAFGTTASALLIRAQDARTTQSIAIASYFIAYVAICIPMALLGAGVWSLVTAWLSQALVNSVLLYSRARHSLRPLIHPDHIPMLTFGLRILGANICSWGIFNLDNTIVGRMAGPVALGLYNRAFALASPADSITTGLLQVLLPAFSRVQSEPTKLRNIYASVFGLVLLVLLPLFTAISATADVVVLGLYGRKWVETIPYVRPIMLAMAVNSSLAVAGTLLAARGKPQKEFEAQLLAVTVAGVAYVTAIQWSILALSWTVLGVYLFRLILLTNAVHRNIESRWSDLFATAWPALALSIFAAAVAKLIALLLPAMTDVWRLFYVAGGSATAVLIVLAAGARYFLRPILSRSPQLLTLVPSGLRPLLT